MSTAREPLRKRRWRSLAAATRSPVKEDSRTEDESVGNTTGFSEESDLMSPSVHGENVITPPESLGATIIGRNSPLKMGNNSNTMRNDPDSEIVDYEEDSTTASEFMGIEEQVELPDCPNTVKELEELCFLITHYNSTTQDKSKAFKELTEEDSDVLLSHSILCNLNNIHNTEIKTLAQTLGDKNLVDIKTGWRNDTAIWIQKVISPLSAKMNQTASYSLYQILNLLNRMPRNLRSNFSRLHWNLLSWTHAGNFKGRVFEKEINEFQSITSNTLQVTTDESKEKLRTIIDRIVSGLNTGIPFKLIELIGTKFSARHWLCTTLGVGNEWLDSPSQLLREDGNMDAILLAALTVTLTPNMKDLHSTDYNKLTEEISALDWREVTMSEGMWYTNTFVIQQMLNDHSQTLLVNNLNKEDRVVKIFMDSVKRQNTSLANKLFSHSAPQDAKGGQPRGSMITSIDDFRQQLLYAQRHYQMTSAEVKKWGFGFAEPRKSVGDVKTKLKTVPGPGPVVDDNKIPDGADKKRKRDDLKGKAGRDDTTAKKSALHSYKLDTGRFAKLDKPLQKEYTELRDKYQKVCICFVCGAGGHDPQAHTPAERAKPEPSVQAKMKAGKDAFFAGDLEDTVDAVVITLEEEKLTEKPTLIVSIGDITIEALGDSGCSYTIISTELFNEIKLLHHLDLRNSPVKLKSASGGLIENHGEIVLTLDNIYLCSDRVSTLASNVEVQVIVASIKWDMILGFQNMGQLRLLTKLQELYDCLADPVCRKQAAKLRACCLHHSTSCLTCNEINVATVDEVEDKYPYNSTISSLSKEEFELIGRIHRQYLHCGQYRTYRLLQSQNLLNSIPDRSPITREMVAQYIKYCDFCEKNTIKDLDAQWKSTFSYNLGKDWEMDVLYAGEDMNSTERSRLKKKLKTSSKDGVIDLDEIERTMKLLKKKYLVTFIERFSRHLRIIPIFDLTETEITRAMIHIIGEFPVCDNMLLKFLDDEGKITTVGKDDRTVIHTDGGKNFIASVNKSLMTIFGFTHQVGVPYSHQDQAMIENRNRGINGCIRALLYDIEELWGDVEIYCPLVCRVLNSIPVESTGYAPSEILMPGMSVNTKLTSMRIKKPKPDRGKCEQYVSNLYDIQDHILKSVNFLQSEYADKRLKRSDTVTDVVQVGELVLCRYTDRQRPSKWTTLYHGPYQVTSQKDEYVNIQDLSSRHVRTVHITNLKRYFFDKRFTDPVVCAAKDRREQLVDKIVSHVGKPANRMAMTFTVLWVSGTESEEPWDKVKHLEAMDKYIDAHSELRTLRTKKHLSEVNLIERETALPSELPQYLEDTSTKIMKWYYPPTPLEDGVDGAELENLDWISQSQRQSQSQILDQIQIGGTEEEKQKIRELIIRYIDVFQDLGVHPMAAPAMKLALRNPNQNSIYIKQGPMKQAEMDYCLEMVKKLKDIGVVVPATADENGKNWNTRINMIDESIDNTVKYRFCLDYSPLNRACTGSSSRMPNISEIFQQLEGQTHLGKFDLKKYFYQIELDKVSQPLTAFTLPTGERLMWTRCPMGVAHSPGHAQTVSSDLFGERIYMDDCLVKGAMFEDFLSDLETCLQTAQRRHLKLAPDKTILNVPRLDFLGRTVGSGAHWLQEDTKKAVQGWRKPTFVTEMQSFLGLCGYCLDYVPDLATLLLPLRKGIEKLISKKKAIKSTTQIQWDQVMTSAFEQVKTAICNSGALSTIDPNRPLYLNTDASNVGYGAILYQLDEHNQKQMCKILSGKFDSTQCNWPTIEQEAYAIFKAITKWRSFLLGSEFIVYTDHRNLTYILKHESKKILRWRLALQEFSFLIYHIPGKDNVEADILSRLFDRNKELMV